MKFLICKAKKGTIWAYIIPISILAFFIFLIFLALFNLRVTSKSQLAQFIHRDITQLKNILEKIDKECKILSFDYQKNRINFLNVPQKLPGSEVGPMNLAYPKNWKGPYLVDNPTYLNKEYLVVQTNDGYFITPGEKVKLPNEKIIGKDIILNKEANISTMMTQPDKLMFKNQPLAVKLNIKATAKPAPLPLNLLQ